MGKGSVEALCNVMNGDVTPAMQLGPHPPTVKLVLTCPETARFQSNISDFGTDKVAEPLAKLCSSNHI